jgi:hypothetical protein
VGKKKKPKQEVTKYALSMHFGICAGPVEYLSNIFIAEKPAWPTAAPVLWTVAGTAVLRNDNLFGGLKKEGGVDGNVTWLPGTSTQLMPELLAAKHGRTSATMPAYRGIASIFFANRPRQDMRGFYWQANSPYLPGVWCEVGRASIGLAALYAKIFRTSAALTSPGIDFGTLGTGNDAYQWDTNGDWCVRGESTVQVFSLPDGEIRTISAIDNSLGGGTVHITDDGELFRRTGGNIFGTAPTFLDIYRLSDLELVQSISLYDAITSTGAPFDHNIGIYADDILVDDIRYALGWFAPSSSGAWILFKKDGVLWSIDSAHALGATTPEGYGVYTLSMGLAYAYAMSSYSESQMVLVHWNGSFSAAWHTPPGLAGRTIRLVHYFEATDEVILICNNGDVLVYDAAVSTLRRSMTGNGSLLGAPGGLLAKRMDLGGNFIALPEGSSSGVSGVFVDWIRIVDVGSLTVTQTITVNASPFVNPDAAYTWCGINMTWGGAYMASHLSDTSFWFLAPMGKFDSNPAHIIYECLTNTNWGMGAPASAVDVDGFNACGVVLYNEGFGLSMIWTRQSAIEDFITEVLDHIEATLFVNPRTGLLTLKLIRNDYSIPSLPVFTPDNSLVTNFSRKLWGETINEIVVTWTNPENEEEETVVAQDLANIEAQGGVISDGRNYYGVRNASLATRLAHRDLRSASTPLAKCDIEINRTAWALLPGDCCVLDSPEDGIDSIVMRVGPVDYGKPGDSTVRVSLVEDIFSLALADYTEPPESEWTDPSEPPSTADHAGIITLPYYVTVNLIDAAILEGVDYPEVFAGVLAAEDGQDTDTFELYGEATNAAGGTGYENFGTKTIASRATLPNPLAIEVETVILSFPDRTQGNGPVAGGLMIIEGSDETDSEICLVSDFGVSGYTFTRGVLDTVPRAWPAGTPVWFIDASMNFADDIDIRAEGETVNYKILPSTSQGTLSELAAPVESATMTARPHLPFRPADVEVNGDDGFSGVPVDITGLDPIPVTWARRNRLTETSIIKAWDEGDVSPEGGQTTIIEVLDPTGTSVVTTHAGLSGTSYNVPAASFGGNASGWIRVGSERDGLRELQAYAIQCVIPDTETVTLTGLALAVSVGTVTVGAAGGAPPLDGTSPTAAWSMSRDLLTSFAGGTRYTTATGVNSLNDQSGNGRHMTQATAGSQPSVTTAGPNSRTCADFDGDFLEGAAISNFIAAGAGYMIVSVLFDAIATTGSPTYAADAIMADTGGYAGIFAGDGPTPFTVNAYNYDGNQDYASGSTSIVVATAYVIEWKHESGTLYCRVNGGTWGSTGSGDTQSLGNALRLGHGYASAASLNGKIFEAATWSTVPSGATQDAIVNSFKTWIGAT